MGVMSCSRHDCDNIMCDTYVDGFGYICTECQQEFKEWTSENDIPINTEYQIRKALEQFKEVELNRGGSREISIDEFFRENTKSDF